MYFKAKNQIFVILSLLQNQPKMLWQQNCWLIRSKAKAVINAFVCQTSLSRRIRCIIMKLQYDSIQLLNMRPDTWLSVDKTCNNCCMCATDFLKIKTRKHTFSDDTDWDTYWLYVFSDIVTSSVQIQKSKQKLHDRSRANTDLSKPEVVSSAMEGWASFFNQQ